MFNPRLCSLGAFRSFAGEKCRGRPGKSKNALSILREAVANPFKAPESRFYFVRGSEYRIFAPSVGASP